MPLRNQHAAIPAVAGKRHEIRVIAQRFGRDADVDVARPRLLGHLDGVALMQHQPYLRKAVGDLSQKDILVRDDNKRPTAILGFRTEQALPLRVGVAIDTSNSVTSRFRFEQDAASAFFHQAVNRSSDLGFVMGFENHPTVMQDFASDPDLLSKGVDQLKPGGGTALYDAIHMACQKLRNHPEQDMVARVLVVLSDGQNNAGDVTLERAIDAAQEAEVTIYAISTNYRKYSSGAGFGRRSRQLRAPQASRTDWRASAFPRQPSRCDESIRQNRRGTAQPVRDFL